MNTWQADQEGADLVNTLHILSEQLQHTQGGGTTASLHATFH